MVASAANINVANSNATILITTNGGCNSLINYQLIALINIVITIFKLISLLIINPTCYHVCCGDDC